MKILGYIRVSTNKQFNTGAGLEAQREYLIAEGIRRGADLEIISEDSGRTGSSTKKRPALLEAMARLDRGEAQALAVSKLDRLARNNADFISIMERAKKNKWHLIIGDLSIDTGTPIGEAMAIMVSVFAQLELERIKQRTREGMAVKKSQGAVFGCPVRISPEIVERIVTEYESGKGYREIARLLNSEAIPTVRGTQWHASTVRGSYLASVQ